MELGARNSDSSRLSNNRRLMKHHEAFVACSDRREVALDVRDLPLVANDWVRLPDYSEFGCRLMTANDLGRNPEMRCPVSASTESWDYRLTPRNWAINVGRLSAECQKAARAGKARDEGIRPRGEAVVTVRHTATTV
jgi:hypothetical protein